MAPTILEQFMRSRPRRLTRIFLTTSAMLMLLPVGAGAQRDPEGDDLAESQSSYVGARLLRPDLEVQIGGMTVGAHDDVEGRNRFMFWEGRSLFAGVIDQETGNRLEMVAEFYWFESSINRNADFYLVVLKVSSTPYPNTNWRVATEQNWIDSVMLRDIGPVQQVEAAVNDDGRQGAIRWDWSVPFQNYRWEPERVIEVQQTYAAGINAEGGAMASITEGVNIQAKGVLSANHQVKSRYTITLWRWQMLVLAGATDMSWNLVALDPEHAQDPAYHEYFLVLQSERGTPVHLNFLRFASTLREDLWMWPDNFMELSASLDGVTLSAPEDAVVCEPGFEEEDGGCVRICEEGFNFLEGECVEDCGEGREIEEGACRLVCGENFIADGDKCVPDCAEGMRPEGNACIRDCAPGYRVDDDGCVLDCPEFTHPDGDTCRLNCKLGEYEEDGICKKIPVPLECDVNEHPEGDKCVSNDVDPGPIPGGGVQDDECNLHTDCPGGSHCEAHRCVSQCLLDVDCGGGMGCNDRAMCVPLAGLDRDGDVDPSAKNVSSSGGCGQAAPSTVGMDLIRALFRR